MWLPFLLHACMVKVLTSLESSMCTGRMLTDSIKFVVTNRGGSNCSFALDATASVMDLKRSVVDSCTVSSNFDIQLFGETIVSSQTPINEIIAGNTHIMTASHDLYQIWGNGFRIPITMHPIMAQNVNIFESLSKLFGGPRSNVYKHDWYKFILQCLDESPKCTVQDLCDRWEYFTCDNGALISIKLRQKLTGHIDLTLLPDSIVSLALARNWFTEIIGLEKLAGKRLQYLDVRGSPLEIDLEPLTKTSWKSILNPLTFIRVNVYQISRSLLGIGIRQQKHPDNHREREEMNNQVHDAALKWFRSSILDCMTLGRSRFTKTTDGLVFHESRQQRSDNHYWETFSKEQLFQLSLFKSVNST